jgi:hypothetical protein
MPWSAFLTTVRAPRPTVASSVAVTVVWSGAVPVTVARLTRGPGRAPAVTVVVAVPVVDAPGARVVAARVIGPSLSSVRTRPVSGTPPVLVTVNVYVTVSPTRAPRAVLGVLTRLMAAWDRLVVELAAG